MSLKARVDRLYSGTISTLTAQLTVYKDKKVVKQKIIGNNQNKVIKIDIRL